MGAPRFPNERLLADQGRWRGAWLEIWKEAGKDLGETVLPLHAITLTLGPTDGIEVKFSGERAQPGLPHAGSVCVVPAGAPYRVRRFHQARVPAEMVVLRLDPAFITSVCGTRCVDLRPSFGADPLLASILTTLGTELRNGPSANELYAQSLLVAVAAHLGRTSFEHGADDRAGQVRDFIEAHLHEPLSLPELAAVAHCDVRSFTRWFREAFGTSAHQYVSAARIERVKQRLERSGDALASIAVESGFSSQSHLTTVFRRHTGVTPGRFRKRFTALR